MDCYLGREPRKITCLFPEILAIIFQHLDVRDKGRAARVCRVWRDVARRRSVWRGVEAKVHVKQGVAFSTIEQRGICRIKLLSLRSNLKDMFTAVPGLVSLDMSGCYSMTDIALRHALIQNDRLTRLDLGLCKQITDQSLRRISAHVKNLTHLDLGGCSCITDGGLFFLARGLKKLISLSLRSCWHVTDRGLAYIAGTNVRLETGVGPSRRRKAALRVSATTSSAFTSTSNSSSCPTSSAAMNEPEDMTGVEKLSSLNLQDCQLVSDVGLQHLAAGLANLTNINLSFCMNVSDHGLAHLTASSAAMTLPRRGEIVIEPLPGRPALALETVTLRHCENISDEGIGHLARSASRLTLRSLDLAFCERVTDRSLEYLSAPGSRCCELLTVSVDACTVTDEGVRRLAEGVPKLEGVGLGQCPLVTEEGVRALGVALGEGLRWVDVYGCPRVGMEELEEVVLQYPQLKGKVRLAMCTS